jgi:hypothetical protein
MSVNIENATILMTAAYIKGASDAFGDKGGVALRLLLDSVKLILAARPPEFIIAPLTILVLVGDHAIDTAVVPHVETVSLADAEGVADYIAQRPDQECFIAIAPDRTFRVCTPTTRVDHKAAAVSAVVYHRRDGIEWIAAGDSNEAVLKLSPISASNFADPTVSSLDDALDQYGRRARESAHESLKPIWEGGADGARLVLVNRPEHIMRESLFQALSMMLRRADVTREHMVDAQKPVDIHVSWTGSPAEALVEIKWLGRSLTARGSKSNYTDCHANRAQEGADQLANYLDLKKSSSAKRSVVGYLVVFDARRGKIRGPNDKLARADALRFEHEDLTLDPDHAKLRIDFKQPKRWFMQPRETSFSEVA